MIVAQLRWTICHEYDLTEVLSGLWAWDEERAYRYLGMYVTETAALNTFGVVAVSGCRERKPNRSSCLAASESVRKESISQDTTVRSRARDRVEAVHDSQRDRKDKALLETTAYVGTWLRRGRAVGCGARILIIL